MRNCKRGLIALTVVAVALAGAGEATHWHQMSDTVEHVDPEALAAAHAYAWQLLQEVDGSRR
jgi:hypothetical protein